MNGFEGVQENLVIDTGFDGEPVELVENRGYVADDRGSSDDTGSRILDQLKFMEEFVGETNEKGITII